MFLHIFSDYFLKKAINQLGLMDCESRLLRKICVMDEIF